MEKKMNDSSSKRATNVYRNLLYALVLYNIGVVLWACYLIISGVHSNLAGQVAVPWFLVFIMGTIVLVLAVSTFGLALKKPWGYLLQLILCALQLFVIKMNGLNLALYLGFQYVIRFNFKQSDFLGVNITALIYLIILSLLKKEFLKQRGQSKR